MRDCKRAVLALWAAILGASTAAADPSNSWTLGGSLGAQNYAAYGENGGSGVSGFSYGSNTKLDLDLDVSADRARASASVEAAVLGGSAAELAWAAAGSAAARKDELLLPQTAAANSTLVAGRLRTLYLKLDLGWSSLSAGRQVLNYGRGALWSPADIFTELDLSGLSPLRLGTDSLLLDLPFGDTGTVDLVGAPTADPSAGRYLLRIRDLVADLDGAISAGRDGKDWIAGVDFKTDLIVGLYADAVYAIPDTGAEGRFRAAGGMDWSLGDFIFAAEYYYNGGGPELDPLFPGTHNLYGNITWRTTELSTLSATTVWDISDQSGSATLLGTLSAAQSTDIGVYVKALVSPSVSSPSYETGLNLVVKF